LCLKRPILSWANICRGLASTRYIRRHSPTCFGRTRYIRRHSPTCFGRTRYIWWHSPTCFGRTRYILRHSPKGFFEKNVTRLDTFARVIIHSSEFGASGHCLVIIHFKLTRSQLLLLFFAIYLPTSECFSRLNIFQLNSFSTFVQSIHRN